jgi:hypothetical protein
MQNNYSKKVVFFTAYLFSKDSEMKEIKEILLRKVGQEFHAEFS